MWRGVWQKGWMCGPGGVAGEAAGRLGQRIVLPAGLVAAVAGVVVLLVGHVRGGGAAVPLDVQFAVGVAVVAAAAGGNPPVVVTTTETSLPEIK